MPDVLTSTYVIPRRDREVVLAVLFAVYLGMLAFWILVADAEGVLTHGQEASLAMFTGPTGWMRAILRSPFSWELPTYVFLLVSGTLACFGGVLGGLQLRHDTLRILPLCVVLYVWGITGLGVALYDF